MNLGPERPSDSLSRDRFHPAVLIATGCGIGYLPIAPGTWASLISLPLAWLIAQNFGQVGLAAAALGALIVGIWASGTIERLRGEKDPSSVVIDEIAGQWFALTVVAPDLLLYGAGFVLFRIADIFKPWPVSWAESLPGGFGVMMDDVLAGIYAGIGVYLLSIWL